MSTIPKAFFAFPKDYAPQILGIMRCLILPEEENRFHTLSFRLKGGICLWLAASRRKRTADSSTA